MPTFKSYIGPLQTGSQNGPLLVISAIPSMFPEHSTSGPGSLPVPAAKILAGGTTGTAYSETVDETQGGVSPYTFAVTSGALPTSLSLNSTTGVISGTPSVAGTFNFTITVTDQNGSTGSTPFQIAISVPATTGSAFGFIS